MLQYTKSKEGSFIFSFLSSNSINPVFRKTLLMKQWEYRNLELEI